MEMINLSLQTANKFVTDYIAQTKEIMNFFHYSFQHQGSYEDRLNELKTRKFMRQEVADYIEKYMEKFPSSESVQQSINKLREDDSVVVIGGQQAGILTGPLYSIHKVISIILLAKEKEAELGIPVVPVFWVAGEDHDYLEVNHIFTPGKEKMEKKLYPQKIIEKKMASDISLDKNVCLEWIEDVVESYGETEFSQQLLIFLKEAIAQSDTFVDLFSYITMGLFREYGLLLVDSGDKNLRLLEKEIFLKQIDHADKLADCVKEQQSIVKESGYPLVIEMSENPANLFYYDEAIQERVLLQFDAEQNVFIGKDKTVQFTKKQLKEIASEFPNKLSNNVVTRPITQDLLFPTLAFIGGPGEIAYWAELKKAFEWMGIKMPPIVPRLNITLLERCVEADMKELQLTISEVITSGTKEKCEQFLHSVANEKIAAILSKVKEDIQKNYLQLEDEITKDTKGLLPLLKKNEGFILKQLDFMGVKVEESVKHKHEVIVNKFNRMERNMKPDGAPQERVWNITYFLNKYGLDFLDELMKVSMEFDGKHKVIKL
ncbi:bacillithiol biosynthesis cysteine-adding enzyme BshC [Niallia sp. 03190]|uniref:bacillithiol biosynthesis cysteine-adding enzyme BshC n=1 Tax=Niallia sp. 03190 TaxID=3458061 RepID=UPI0040442845